MRKKNEKTFWDMEIIGNRRKNTIIVQINCNTDNSLSLTLCKPLVLETCFNFALEQNSIMKRQKYLGQALCQIKDLFDTCYLVATKEGKKLA